MHGEVVLLGDLLRAQVLLHRQRVVGAALHRGVVRDDDHLAPAHAPDAGDDARRRARRRRTCPPAASGLRFKNPRGGVDHLDALARGELAARAVPLGGLGAAALIYQRFAPPQLRDRSFHLAAIGIELRAAGVQRRGRTGTASEKPGSLGWPTLPPSLRAVGLNVAAIVAGSRGHRRAAGRPMNIDNSRPEDETVRVLASAEVALAAT